MNRFSMKLLFGVLGVVWCIVMCGTTALGSLLYEASLRNGDYGGGVSVDTLDPNHGGSPHVLGVLDSAEGVTFTPTESDGRSNAFINFPPPEPNRNLFRTHGTVSMWIKGDQAAHSVMTSWGAFWGENYGWDKFNNGQGTFSGASSRIANGEGPEDDQLSITWKAWHNDVWYNFGGVVLEYGQWYHLGFTWGGLDHDYELWVNGVLQNYYDLPDGVYLPWGMDYIWAQSGKNWGLGDGHERGYDPYGSNVGITYADMRMWDEYRAMGDSGLPPVADFTATSTIGFAPLTVNFTDASTNTPTAWAWDFDDGSTSNEQHPTHEFTEEGTYHISLSAENENGEDEASKEHYVLVTFPDVPFEPTEFWALHEILACVDAGIVQGYWDGYHPGTVVKRDQMATFIARAMCGGDAYVPTAPATPTFADVTTDNWAYQYIEYCAAQNIAQGYWDGYHPNTEVKRDQMAVYMARCISDYSERPDLPSYTPPATATFPDVATDNWAFKYIEFCYANGIVSGYWDGYHPTAEVKRDQMAVYIQRAFALPM